MNEIESLFKVFGMPGAFIGCILYALKVVVPILQRYLENNESIMKSIAASLNENITWQRTIDLRLDRLERQSDETNSSVERLADAAGFQLRKKRQVVSNEDR